MDGERVDFIKERRRGFCQIYKRRANEWVG